MSWESVPLRIGSRSFDYSVQVLEGRVDERLVDSMSREHIKIGYAPLAS